MVLVSQFMKAHGKPQLLHRRDWPTYVEGAAGNLRGRRVAALFKACTLEEAVRYKFYLLTGFRDREGQTVTRRDLDVKHSQVRVTAKPHWGFKPKKPRRALGAYRA
jgi:hypothetical protein